MELGNAFRARKISVNLLHQTGYNINSWSFLKKEGTLEIRLSDLSQICTRLFFHLEELEIETIDVSEDFYWNIQKSELYDPYQNPNELDLGQLSDDWNELQKILSAQQEPYAYGLVHLAPILRLIGEKVIV